MCPVARARPRGLDLRYPGIIIWIHNRASNEGSRRFHNHGKGFLDPVGSLVSTLWVVVVVGGLLSHFF